MWRLVVLLVLVAFSWGGVWAWGRWQAAHHERAAAVALTTDDWEAARTHYAEALRYRPEQPALYFGLARTSRRAGDWQEAKTFLKRAADLGHPPDRIALENLLLDVQLTGWRSHSDRLAARLATDDPDAARIYEVLAQAYYKENLVELALVQTKEWLTREPESPSAWELAGQIHERMNNKDLAYDAYQNAVAKAPQRFAAQLGTGNMAYARGDLPESLGYLEAAERLNANDRDVQMALARTLADLQRFPEARQHSATALLLDPDSYLVQGLAGRVELLAGDYHAAEKFFKAATTTVSDAKILADYRLCLARLRRLDDAKALDTRIQEVETDLGRVRDLRAAMQNLNDPAPRTEVGQLLAKHGLLNEGRGWLLEALKLDPNYAPAHAALAVIYEKQNRPEQAAYHRQRAVKN